MRKQQIWEINLAKIFLNFIDSNIHNDDLGK